MYFTERTVQTGSELVYSVGFLSAPMSLVFITRPSGGTGWVSQEPGWTNIMEISKPNTLRKGCCAKVRMTSKQQFSQKISLMPDFLKAFFAETKLYSQIIVQRSVQNIKINSDKITKIVKKIILKILTFAVLCSLLEIWR